MTRLIKRDPISPTLVSMCLYFRLDPKRITFIERTEILLIYSYAQQHGANGIEEAQLLIPTLPARKDGRSKRKRLYQLYSWCLNEIHIANGADTHVLKPPADKPLWNDDEE